VLRVRDLVAGIPRSEEMLRGTPPSVVAQLVAGQGVSTGLLRLPPSEMGQLRVLGGTPRSEEMLRGTPPSVVAQLVAGQVVSTGLLRLPPSEMGQLRVLGD
jgi:uncharacterized membrane protein